MKTLLLLRHAKSSWDDHTLPDHRRPLSRRGLRAAPAMAEHLRELALLPELIVSSTSERTRQTVEMVVEHLDDPPVQFDDSVYLAGPSQLLGSIRSADDAVETLMLVGHNPGMHAIAVALSDGRPSPANARLDAKFPTAAVAVIDFDVDRWRDVGPGLGHLADFIRPKDLPNAEDDRL